MSRQLKGLETRRMLVMLGKVTLAAAALAAVCAASSHWVLADWETQTFSQEARRRCSATIIAGGLVFAGAGVALHIEELKELQAALSRRFRRGR